MLHRTFAVILGRTKHCSLKTITGPTIHVNINTSRANTTLGLNILLPPRFDKATCKSPDMPDNFNHHQPTEALETRVWKLSLAMDQAHSILTLFLIFLFEAVGALEDLGPARAVTSSFG